MEKLCKKKMMRLIDLKDSHHFMDFIRFDIFFCNLTICIYRDNSVTLSSRRKY